MCTNEVMLGGSLLHIIISFFTHKVHDDPTSDSLGIVKMTQFDDVFFLQVV